MQAPTHRLILQLVKELFLSKPTQSMIDSVQIENALNRINGDIFQEFCNHFLYLKLNPNTITPIGSVIGKEKSRKGIPDSYFTNAGNELIFAEYTTKERLEKGQSFYNKLESDIENCFDTSKTGLKKEEINKVILCFTERIKPFEKKNLEELTQKHNPNCTLELKGIRDLAFAVLDYPILGAYVGIKVGTGQIQEPSEFISNYEKNKISTPLSNTFYDRNTEIEEGLNHLDTKDIIIVHGAPGTGKSKYSIELAKKFSDKNGFCFLCIGNKGIPIWEDLKTHIVSDKKYVLLIDDANRVAKNFQWILSLFEERDLNTLKVIVTVRDYALPQVKSISANFNYEMIEIGAFSNDEIKKIIQSEDFKITEPSYVDRILKIAQGNARLAIMCAKVALNAKNILELEDVSQIYDEYFEPLFKEVELLKEPVAQKSLAIISFFSRVDKENRNLCDFIFSNLDIEEDKFWEVCYSLHESELVDLFEQQVVKISDQIFATYIFYKAVIVNENLSFNFFLDNYLDYESRITDTIVPVINTFDYKRIEEKLKPIILKKWIEIEQQNNDQNSLKYLDLFWFYLSPQVINFLKKQIDNQEAETSTEFRYNYELNEFSYGTGKDLEILSRFRYHSDEFFKDALELIFYYAIKVSTKMPAVIYIIKEKFSFTRLGYMYGDRIQHLLFDFLISRAQIDTNKVIYKNILTEVIPDFLKIEYRENESNGRAFTLYTFQLWLSDSVRSFRTKCFNYLLESADKAILLKVLYQLNYYEYKDSDEILKHDLQYIYQIINKHFLPDEFEDCFVLQNILEGLDWLKIDYSHEIRSEYNSKLYKLAEVLKRDRERKREIGWDEEEKLHKQELKEYCTDFDIDSYESLFINVSLILESIKKVSDSNSSWQYEHSLNTIFGNLAQSDAKLFLEALELNFSKFNFNINFAYIFNSFFQQNSPLYFSLFELIKGLGSNIKFTFHESLNVDSVKTEHLDLLYSDLLSSINSLNSQYVFWDLSFISKYEKLKSEKDIYVEILEIILSKIKKEEVKISVAKKFIEKCLSFESFPFEMIVEAFLYSNDIEHSFDYKNEILKKLLERDSNIIIRILKFNSPNRISYHDLEHEHYDFIWELENSVAIINSIFDYFIASETYYFSERAIAAFFPSGNDKYGKKPIEYLEDIITEKYLNDKYIDVVYSIVSHKFPNLKMDFLERILKLNSDFETFKNLEIIPRSRSWSGSYIPILESEKKVWKNVISVLDRLPNRLSYYDHKDYANRQIGYCDIRIKDEMKREFYEDFR